jgi:hypothetical protein
MSVDDEHRGLVRASVRQALARSSDGIASALDGFGWPDLVAHDEALAFTALFEEQGLLAVDTSALDVAALVTAGSAPGASVVWPLEAEASELGPGGRLEVEGVALGPLHDGPLLVAAADALHQVAPTRIETAPVRGMARDLPWVRVRVEGRSVGSHGSWVEVRRRSCLALSSELTGVAQRMLDLAVGHVSHRRQFGRPVASYQAVRHRLAEAHSDVVGARALVAAAWADGRPSSAAWSKAVSGLAHDAVAKHALQVCGAIGFDESHELPRLVRRGFSLDALLGASRTEASRVGVALLGSQRAVPVGSF